MSLKPPPWHECKSQWVNHLKFWCISCSTCQTHFDVYTEKWVKEYMLQHTQSGGTVTTWA